MNDEEYRIEALGDGLWALDDSSEDSLYLIEGSERALLIDTGAAPGELLPMLRKFTSKPIDLALTHAHIDHMAHANEFERVYLHRADFEAWRFTLKPLFATGRLLYPQQRVRIDEQRFIPLDEGAILDPGGCPIQMIHAPGHTPGSAIFRDDLHRALFTGDAFGSGEAAWMWLPGCQNVRRYRESLNALLCKLEPFAEYRFFGGHRLQGIQSERHPHAWPLDIQVPRDMAALCGAMLSGENSGKPVKLMPFLRLRVYRHGHAAMVQRRSKIR